MITIKRNNQELRFHNYDEPKDVPESVIEMVERFVISLRYLIQEQEDRDIGYQAKKVRIEAALKAMELNYTPFMLSQFLRELKSRRYGIITFEPNEVIRFIRRLRRLGGDGLKSYIYNTMVNKFQNKEYADKYSSEVFNNLYLNDMDLEEKMLRFLGYKSKEYKTWSYGWFIEWKNKEYETHKHEIFNL